MINPRVVVRLLVVLLALEPIKGQEAASQVDVWRAFATTLDAGSLITVELTDGTRVKGNFLKISGDVLEVLQETRVAGQVRQVPLSVVRTIDRQKARKMNAASKIVIAAGVAAAVAAMYVLYLGAHSQ